MTSEQGRSRSGGVRNAFGLILLATLLLVAAWPGGADPLWLELIGFALLVGALLDPDGLRRLSAAQIAALLAIPLTSLLQLVPLPFSVWSLIGAYRPYADALAAAGPELIEARPLSLVPDATRAALFTLVAPLGVVLMTAVLPADRLRSLLLLLLTIALLQSLYALGQYLAASDTDWSGAGAGRVVSGGFPNREHLVGLLAMLLPAAAALLLATLGKTKNRERYKTSLHGFVALPLTAMVDRSTLYAATLLLLLAGLVATRLPAAVPLAGLGLVLSAMAFAGRIGGSNVFGWRGSLAVAVGLALLLLLLWLLHRQLAVTELGAAGREMALASFSAIAAFLPWGSGMGTFSAVFPRFQPEVLAAAKPVPSSDYLAWLLGGGVFAVALLVLIGFVYLQQWWWLWQFRVWSTFRFVQTGAGLGLLLVAVQSVFDANLHLPANAVYTAFLAGLFFTRPQQKSDDRYAASQHGGGRRKRRRSRRPPVAARAGG